MSALHAGAKAPRVNVMGVFSKWRHAPVSLRAAEKKPLRKGFTPLTITGWLGFVLQPLGEKRDKETENGKSPRILVSGSQYNEAVAKHEETHGERGARRE